MPKLTTDHTFYNKALLPVAYVMVVLMALTPLMPWKRTENRPMKPFNILITGAGTTTAVTALKGLRAMKDSSIHITMGDMQQNCAGVYLGDDFVQMPSATAPDFIERAISICRDREIDLAGAD